MGQKSELTHILLIVTIFVSAAACPMIAAEEPETGLFHLTAGLGYDLVTQGYYLSRIDTMAIEEDSLVYLRQTSEALDDVRLKTRIEWSAPASRIGRLETDWLTNLSKEDVRSSLRILLKSGPVTLENETVARGTWKTGETAGTGYLTNETTGRLKHRIAKRLFLTARNSYELIRYDGGNEYEIDYNYNRFSIGLEREFGWTGLVALTYRNDYRVVGDSTRLNYVRHRAIFELDWSPTFDLTVGLENELTRTESSKEASLDDGWRELIEGEVRVSLGDRWSVRLKNRFEYVTYDQQDVVDFDYVYNTAELSVSCELTPDLEMTIEPSALFFSSTHAEFAQQDYRQAALEYGLDISRARRFWLTVSHKIGVRDYTRESDDFYTDCLLNQLNLLGDVELLDNLRLNTIVSVDWEIHDSEHDDNSLLLLSIGLDYRFR